MQAGAGIFKPYLYVSLSQRISNAIFKACFKNVVQT